MKNDLGMASPCSALCVPLDLRSRCQFVSARNGTKHIRCKSPTCKAEQQVLGVEGGVTRYLSSIAVTGELWLWRRCVHDGVQHESLSHSSV